MTSGSAKLSPRPRENFARQRRSWAATARQALLYALPLAFVALLAAQWLDADYLVLRESARRDSQRAAEALGIAAGNEVSELAVFSQINVARAEAEGLDPPQALWRVISGYDFELLVLIREGERTLFPPEDPLAMPRMWEEKLRTLIEASKFLHEGDFVNGWFPSATGEFYFECRRFGADDARRETCIALNSRFIFPNMIAALNSRSRAYDGWAFRLRDPFDRVIWKKGDAPEGYESFIQKETLHGWAVDVGGAPALSHHSTFGRLALAAPLAMVWLLLVWQARRAEKARLAESAARAALAAAALARPAHPARQSQALCRTYRAQGVRRSGSRSVLRRADRRNRSSRRARGRNDLRRFRRAGGAKTVGRRPVRPGAAHRRPLRKTARRLGMLLRGPVRGADAAAL